MELYKQYRPKTWKDILGQDTAVRLLKSKLAEDELPHALLLTGPSGCGKTTIGRVLKDELECSEMDYHEVNGADDTGVDMVRSIRDKMRTAALGGKSRVWMIDEAHMLTKPAQNCLLKSLEDTPRHVYFILATTDPGKLLRTIQTRCTEIALKGLSQSNLRSIVDQVADAEGISLDEEVMDKILLCCEGSARQALVFLDQIRSLEDSEDQLDAISPSRIVRAANEIWKELMAFSGRPSWANVSKVLRELEDDPEGVRRMILAASRTMLLKEGGKFAPRAYLIIDTFRDSFFYTGAAGLAAKCYEIVTGASK